MIITLHNPPMNASFPAMHLELSHIFTTINRDPAVKVVVLTGAGEKAFSAGGDVKNMLRRLTTADHAAWLRGMREAKDIVYSILRLEKPLITRINGHAMGLGATLAVLGDFSYMIETAQIADTHVKVGLTAGDGGSMMWPLLMGFTKARQHLLTGDPLTGKEAAELGLITGSAANMHELDELCFGMAERLASGATLAINATKNSINLLLRRLLEGVIEAHLGAETLTYLSKDHLEAAKAFNEKRGPDFRGE
ncbi:enoyl-CoA hydratase-related protein [Sphingomonas sp. MG17]|jgi:enoyl-CoA hydratase|uniref:Enoyl-CoA hydratase-related protein n=2 Tax=Sphingomonas tagetis TaxID=2949092 RepID=A0A9X2HQZ9_9SPHN|nr:enoyl-CoA hydratase-related protein [Sphingomonas tagetis]